jgi:hypothetical protein
MSIIAKISTGYPHVYPQKNITDNIILEHLWRKMEESGEWSTL